MQATEAYEWVKFHSFLISALNADTQFRSGNNNNNNNNNTVKFQEVEGPWFLASRHLKLARLPALRTGRFYPQGNIAGTNIC